MLCLKPFHKRGAAFGCGQCMPCRINRRRLWTSRIMLEALVSADASFLTLTYSPENVPDAGSLAPRDLTLFLKRLRKHRSFRYFAVGEYGDHSERPHYHAALFGIGVLDTALVRAAWGLGHVMLGELTLASAAYVAGYVTKKMTAKDDVRLNGRYPEFARMSLRPGIGAGAIPDIASTLLTKWGWNEVTRLGDVPTVFRSGPASLPLGRYLRSQLRAHVGIKKGGDTGVEAFKKSLEMQSLRSAHDPVKEGRSFFQKMEEEKVQARLNQEGRHKLGRKVKL